MSKIVALSILAIALLGLLDVWANTALSSSREAELSDVALSLRDVSSSWVPSDFNEAHVQGLWDTLPDILTAHTRAVLHLSAFETNSDLSGASTVLIHAEQAMTLPQNIAGEQVLGPLLYWARPSDRHRVAASHANSIDGNR